MEKRILTLVLVLVLVACGKHDDPAATTAARARAPLEHASQADLAREIADAELRGTWNDVQQRWLGQTLTWTITRHRLLCNSADDCNVAAFPLQRPAQQGWMPLLTFAPGQYDALATTCGDREPCELTIAGTLSALEVSPELPTQLRLTAVRVVPPPVKTARL
jgi:hypothetical protein